MKMVQRYPDVFVLITPAQWVGGKILNKTALQKGDHKNTHIGNQIQYNIIFSSLSHYF